MSTHPEGDASKTWAKVKRYSLELFETYFERAEHKKRSLIYADLEFDEWIAYEKTKRLKGLVKYFGTIDIDTEKKHGVIREVLQDGRIFESSYLKDDLHGLSICYSSDLVRVSFFVAGVEKAYFTFDPDTFIQKERKEYNETKKEWLSIKQWQQEEVED